jgi:hypothetical protein
MSRSKRGFVARRSPSGHELADEGAIDSGGLENRERLAEFTGLHRLVSYVVPVEALTEKPAADRKLV